MSHSQRLPPRILPPHNLFGDHGPRCPHCSGLGQVLALGGGGRPVTRSTSRCTCKGTGIDQEALLGLRLSEMERQIRALERRLLFTHRAPPVIKNSRQYWEELIAWNTVNGTAIANSATEAIIFPNITIPANYMADGRVLRLTLKGRWSNVVTAVPTLTFRARYGGVAGTPIIAASGAVVTPATATTDAIWEAQLNIRTISNGATGSIYGIGKLTMGEDAVPTFGTVTNYGVVSFMGSAGVAAPVAVTADLTADWALALTATWSAANAANSVQGHEYLVESLN